MPMKLYDLLGVAGPEPGATTAAAALWPAHPDAAAILGHLQDVLELRALHPGASADGVGVTCEVHVISNIASTPLTFPDLPDVEFNLQLTDAAAPARLFVTRYATGGVEWVVESLPVEMRLPANILQRVDPEGTGPSEVTYPEGYAFPAGSRDGLKIVLRGDLEPSSIYVRVKIRCTREGRFVFEPAVPISIGPCKFLALPCFGVHDLNLLVSTSVGDPHTDRELPLEWTRHELDRFPAPGPTTAQLLVRTLDLDGSKEPLLGLYRTLSGDHPDPQRLVLVLEDLALPILPGLGSVPIIPTHARAGIRGNNVTATDPASLEEYDLSDAPIQIRIGSYYILIDKLFLQTPASPDDTFFQFDVAVAGAGQGVTRAQGPAVTVSVLDEWTLQAGVRDVAASPEPPDRHLDEHGTVHEGAGDLASPLPWTPPGLVFFNLPDMHIAASLLGGKLGASIRRIADQTGRYDFGDCVQGLIDLGIFGTNRTATGEPSGSGAASSGPVSLTTRTNRPLELVFRDIGWDRGHVSLDGVAFPDGAELRLFNVIRLVVEDLGWVAENNGGYYFFFSGGVAFDFGGGSQSGSTSGAAASGASGSGTATGSTTTSGDAAASASSTSQRASSGSTAGITFERLRFKVSGAATAPPVLLDGIALSIEAGTFKLHGFGSYHQRAEHDAAGQAYNLEELALGLNLTFDALATQVTLGVQFFYGTITYPDPLAAQSYTYWLAAAQFSPIPIGPVQLVNLRVLAAQNLTPATTANPAAPNMPLLKWYQDNAGDHGEGLSLPEGRQFGNIWTRANPSFAIGIGAGLQFPGGNSVRLDLFVFYRKAPTEEGLLALLQVFLLRATDPCAYGAIEFDFAHNKWGLVLGVDLNLNTVLGLHCDALKFIKLTGTLYAGNPPATFAIGHLNDQDSWLSLIVRLNLASIFTLNIQVGLCIEVVDGGPQGFGFIVSVQGLINLAILEIEAYLTLGLLVGPWRSGSTAFGVLVWFEAGLRIKLFFIFTFGVSGRLQYDSLRSSPGYSKLSGDFHVDTPFFLPSINIHFEQVWDEPHPEQIGNVQPPLAHVAALAPGSQRQIALPITPLFPGDLEDEPGTGRKRIKASTVYSMAQIRTAAAPDYAGQTDAEPIGVDSALTFDFKPSVDDLLAMGVNTPPGASAEPAEPHAAELRLTYELVSLAIQRRPLYGAGAGGAWLPLLTPTDTALFDPLHPDLPNPHAVTTTTLAYHWDGDVTSGGATDPRRLVLNADTPFTLITRNDEADEGHGRAEPGWPCAPGGPARPQIWHVLAFDAIPIGTRAPARPQFSASRSALGWAAPRPPVVGGARWIATGRHVARVPLTPQVRVIASLVFDQLVQELDVSIGWPAQTKGDLWITGYRGATKVKEVVVSLLTAAPASIALALPDGFSSVVIRASSTATAVGVELLELRYLGLREEQLRIARARRAAARPAQLLAGDGKLGWLANHEYEVALTVRATSAMTRTSTSPQVVLVEQRARFVTKGLLGLNAVAHTGEEVAPYVESVCPGPGLPVYGGEAIALAFTPGMNILAPLARAPAPTDPDERAQLLEWALAVDQISGNDAVRVTQTAEDWILAHRAAPPVSRALGRVLDPSIFVQAWRNAPPIDPFRVRLDRLLRSPGGCAAGAPPRLERSQVLEHQPWDPRAGVARWAAGATFVASLRRKGGPCVDRAAFEAGDETAFAYATEGGGSTPWTLDLATDPRAGTLVAGPGAQRQYAMFGELAWNHVVARVRVVPSPGGQAGLAIAVGGAGPAQALIAVLVGGAGAAPPRLQLFARTGGVTTELVPDGGTPGGVALDAAAATYDLEVTAYDDRIRARCGATTVEAARGALRDGKLALVATAGARVRALLVRPLEAYAFPFTASRYATFADHVGSFTGEPAELAADGTPALPARHTVAELFTPAAIAALAPLVGPAGDADERQARFDATVQDLGLPLRKTLARLELTRLVRGGATELFLVESPEPLPLGFDVTCQLTDHLGVPVPLAILPDGGRTRALIVPAGADGAFALPPDAYRMTFTLDRERYRGDLPGARYQASATLTFGTPAAGGRPFIHIARTPAGNTTALVPPVTARDAVLLATPLWNPGGAGGVYCDHPLGIYYAGTNWRVFNQDIATMPANAAFNLAQVAGTLHHATPATISGNVTWLDLPAANGKPHAVVVATPNWNPVDGGGGYVNHRLGVYYAGGRWAIFNQDLAAMPANAAFNVFVPPLDAFVHTSTPATVAGDYTVIDAPGVTGRPDAVLIVTPLWNPGGIGGTYHDHNIGVFYTGGRWAIFNQDLTAMPAGVSFNVWLVGYASPPPP